MSQLSPHNARAYHNMGAMLRSLRRPADAVSFLESVIDLLPNEPNIQVPLRHFLD